MHKGWKELYKYWKWELDRKVEYSHRLLDRILKKHRQPVVCWSGGKDSTVVLHLVRQHKPDISVIYVDSGVEFPETVKFINFLARSWNLNIVVTKPKKDEGFWDIGSKYGWPIFGKNIASNVERAVRTGNIRPQMSLLEKFWLKIRCVFRLSAVNLYRKNQAKKQRNFSKQMLKCWGLQRRKVVLERGYGLITGIIILLNIILDATKEYGK